MILFNLSTIQPHDLTQSYFFRSSKNLRPISINSLRSLSRSATIDAGIRFFQLFHNNFFKISLLIEKLFELLLFFLFLDRLYLLDSFDTNILCRSEVILNAENQSGLVGQESASRLIDLLIDSIGSQFGYDLISA